MYEGKIPWTLVLFGIAAVLILIGIIVAWNIKTADTDKQAGDKRLVAAIFIMSGFIFIAIGFMRKECSSSLFDLSAPLDKKWY